MKLDAQTDDRVRLLKTRFLKEVRVLDEASAYLAAPSFNLRLDPQILSAAAEIIADHFQDDNINIIHGIPHSGNYLATAVAMKFHHDVRLHTSRKDQIIPSTWKEVYRKEVRSFTSSVQGPDVFAGINLSFVRKGDRVLIIDDICARGDTGWTVIKGLQEKGVVVVGFAVLFDKVFQGGLERITELGVNVCSCIRVKRILPTGAVEIE